MRVVIGSAHFVALAMGKLAFNHVRHKPVFIEYGARRATEAVPGWRVPRGVDAMLCFGVAFL